jgi:hypothetical protein
MTKLRWPTSNQLEDSSLESGWDGNTADPLAPQYSSRAPPLFPLANLFVLVWSSSSAFLRLRLHHILHLNALQMLIIRSSPSGGTPSGHVRIMQQRLIRGVDIGCSLRDCLDGEVAVGGLPKEGELPK